MSNSIVASVYSGVIRDVIENVKKDFEDSGVDGAVLTELERIWEHKIRSAKVATWEQNGLSGDDSNQNININGASSSSALYPAQNDSGIKPAFVPQYENTQAAAASLPVLAVQSIHPNNHNNDMNRHYLIKNGNGNLPQVPPASSIPASSDILNRSISVINSQADANASPNIGIGSVDHKTYPSHTMSSKSTMNTIRAQQDLNEKLLPRDARDDNSNSSPQPLPEFTQRDAYADNDDINSDLDDTEDEDANADSEETQNIILCLYDKVTRTKNKWKCQLKDGIMSVNGRDYLFQKGNGDFEF